MAKRFKPSAEIYEQDEQWYVRYEVVKGKPQTMRLDSDTASEARFEAAQLSGLDEDLIEDG